MSEREAAVRLTLDDGQFVTQMRKVGDEAEHAGQKGKHAMGIFGEGVHGAMHAVHGLHKSIETVTELVGGLAAGFSIEEALHTVVDLDAKFKHLAFAISTSTGELVKARDIQEMVEEAAAKAGRRTVEMAGAFEELYKATSDPSFGREALEAIGVTATATGESVEDLTRLAAQLHQKFQLEGKAIPDAFAQIWEAAQKGGPRISEVADVAGFMGAELEEAGLKGERGLDFMVGALQRLHGPLKTTTAAVKGVKMLLSGLGDKAKLKELGKEAGIDPAALIKEKDLLGRLRMVLGKGTKGIAALKATMHEGEEKKALDNLFILPFQEALAKAGKAGKKGHEQIDAALDQLDDYIDDFGYHVKTAADLEKEAAERMKDPKIQLQNALEELEKAFGNPEIISAINDMSQYLPKASAALASFVKFAVSHPLLAGAGVIGGTAAKGFAEAAIAAGLKSGAEKGAKAGMSGLKYLFGGQERGLGLDTYMGPSRMRSVYDSITDAHIAGGVKVGHLMSGILILAAAEMGREFIKAKAEEDAATTSGLAAADAVAGSRSGSIEKQEAEAAALRAAIAKKKASRSGVGGVMEDVFGGLAIMSGQAKHGQTSSNIADRQIREAMKELREKEEYIARLKEEQSRPKPHEREKHKPAPEDHRAAGRAVAEALAAGKALRVTLVDGQGSFGAPGPGGSRGPKKPAHPQPGGGY